MEDFGKGSKENASFKIAEELLNKVENGFRIKHFKQVTHE